jgi:cytochrome oxidase Cu insertion factor (SCO1/SenC/PrrC family)
MRLHKLILATVSIASFLVGCGERRNSETPNSDPPDSEPSDSGASAGVLRLLGRAPHFTLTDQAGAAFSSTRLEGHPWVANFMFTTCPTICPQQTAELKRLQEELEARGRTGEIHLVSFTVDPATDTPEVLQSYASRFGADTKTWKFLTGSVEAMRQTVSREGFKLAVEGDGEELTHSSMFVLVDAYGRLRGLYDSADSNTVPKLLTDLGSLSKEALHMPPDIRQPKWMDARRQAQLDSAASIKAFHGFSFTDMREASGITFRDKLVDDACRNYQALHYDHGTSVSVADVDGDDLPDLYFVSQAGRNGLWRNLGGGKFEDITDAAGVAVADRVCVAGSFADIDNDGDPDLYVTSVRAGNKLFENLGDGTFRDVTEASGTGVQAHSSGAVFFDYDRDGLVDLFVTNVGKYTGAKTAKVTMESIRGEAGVGIDYPLGFPDAFGGHLKPERNEQSVLFRNLGGLKFEDVSQATSLIDDRWSGDATAVDLNADGWPDLYVLSMQGDDEVYLNMEGKSFKRAGRDLFPSTPWGAMGIKAFDFENDGDLDLYITDMHSDMSQEIGPSKEKKKADMQWPASYLKTGPNVYGNAFFRNGGGTFDEVSGELGAENYWPWGLSVDDLNADGFDDAFLTSSMNFPYRYCVNSLLLNDGGERFRDSEFILGVEPRAGGLATPWFELDIDGADKAAPILKKFRANGMDPKNLPKRTVVWGAHGSRSSVLFDLDDDGDLDIVTNEFNGRPMVLVSDLAERNPDLAFLKVKLVGTKSNRSALGAVVRVAAGDLNLMKVKDGQSGYLSHSDFPLYFGLGSAKQIDRLEVSWPSGIKQVVEGPIDLNKMLTIEERE